MPIPVINPNNGDDLTAQSIVANVTEKIRLTYESHEAGLTTNGALQHSSDQISDAAITEATVPTSAPSTGGIHGRVDSYAVVMSAIMGGGGNGYAAKYTAISALTYGSISAINTALTTNAVSTATPNALVRRDAAAGFTSAYINIVGASPVNSPYFVTSATGQSQAIEIIRSGGGAGLPAAGTNLRILDQFGNEGVYGILTTGSGAVAITTPAGLLDATKLTNAIPAASFPAVTGDVTIPAATPAGSVVATVGGKTATTIAAAITSVQAASSTGVANHGAMAKFDAIGGMTFDSTVTAPTFSGALTGNAATATNAGNVTGVVAAANIDPLIARAANVPTNAGIGATGTWGIAISGNAATASNVSGSGITGTVPAAAIDPLIARASNVPTNAGVGATGTWGISISGNAATATTASGVSTGAVTAAGLAAGAVTAPAVGDYSLPMSKFLEGAILPTAITPNLSVTVNAIHKWNGNGQPIFYGGGGIDLTSFVPISGGQSRYVLLEINSTAILLAKAGVPTTNPLTDADRPTADVNTTPLGFVALSTGQTQITTANISPWIGLGGFPGSAISGGSPVGHQHGVGSETRVASIGMDEGFATPTVTPSLSILIDGLHYRLSSGIGQYNAQATYGPFAVPATGYRTIGVYLDPSTGSYAQTAPSDSATYPPAVPAFSGNQRSLNYIHLRSISTIIKAGDDGTNGWIEDARVWLSGSSPTSIPVGVSDGGTGVSAFGTPGIVVAGVGSPTTPFSTIAATTSVTVGLTIAPTTTPGSSDAAQTSLGGGTIATGTTGLSNAVGVDVIAPAKTGTGVITNSYALRATGSAAPIAGTTNAAALFRPGIATNIGVVIDGAVAQSADLQSWRVNGVVVAALSSAGTIGQGGAAAGWQGITQAGTLGGAASPTGIIQSQIFRPSTGGGSVVGIQTGYQVDTTNGILPNAFGLYVPPVAHTAGANAITNAYGIFVGTPTGGTTNYAVGFGTPAGALQQEAYTTPLILGTWGAWGATPQYRRSTENTVHMIGGVASGTGGTAAFNVTTNCYPSSTRYFACVDTNGTLNMVSVSNAGAVSPTVGTRCMLDSVHYPI